MVLIELIDREPIENICTCLSFKPDKIIYLGSSENAQSKIELYRELLAKRGEKIELEFVKTEEFNLSENVRIIQEIIESNTDCYIDLTGGEELCLTAIGIVYERCNRLDVDENGNARNTVQMHFIRIHDNYVADCDADGNVIELRPLPELSVEENIFIHGGKVVREEDKVAGSQYVTHKVEYDKTLIPDLEKLWEICMRDHEEWNRETGLLKEPVAADGLGDDTFIFDETYADTMPVGDRKSTFFNQHKVFRALKDEGFISVDFTNSQPLVGINNIRLKNCFVKQGQLLEIMTYYAAREVRGKVDGKNVRLFNDVETGVVLDWDGIISNGIDDAIDIMNEIDVMMMHGMIPYFVSCKNGNLTKSTEAGTVELYKFSSVAARFGGRYAKKILVCHSLDGCSGPIKSGCTLRARADELGVKIIEIPKEYDGTDGGFIGFLRRAIKKCSK